VRLSAFAAPRLRQGYSFLSSFVSSPVSKSFCGCDTFLTEPSTDECLCFTSLRRSSNRQTVSAALMRFCRSSPPPTQ
jgi:hypothetical protein